MGLRTTIEERLGGVRAAGVLDHSQALAVDHVRIFGPSSALGLAEPDVLDDVGIFGPSSALGLSEPDVFEEPVERARITRDLTQPVAPPVTTGQAVAIAAGDVKLLQASVHGPTCKTVSIGLEPATVTDRAHLALGIVEVSEDLFSPIGKGSAKGHVYAKQAALQTQLPGSGSPPVAKPPSHTRPGRTTPGVTVKKVPSIWELILPLLAPPVVLGPDLQPQLDLPYKLYAYQPLAISKLIQSDGFLLGDEMGTGKTVMATVALRILFQQGDIRKALVVSPPGIIHIWETHLRDWGGSSLICKTIHGISREQRAHEWRYPAHVYVTSYDTLKRDMPLERSARPPAWADFDLVILDEIHHIRNAESDRARAIRPLDPMYRWGLSGTPLFNSVDDLVSIFAFLKPDLPLSKELPAGTVSERIAPYFLRRRKQDVLKDLPPKTPQDIWLDLSTEQCEAYEEALSKGRKEFDEGKTPLTRMHIFALLQTLKQICNFAPGETMNPKVDQLLDQLDEITKDHKAVVFTQYLPEGARKLRPHLQRYGLATLVGDDPMPRREEAVHSFQSDPSLRVLLGTRVAGEGISLTAANYVFMFDHWWTPADSWQKEDRVWRPGQTLPVTVYHYWMTDTIDERIYEILERKHHLHAEIIDALSEKELDNAISMEEWCEVLGLKARPTIESAKEAEPAPDSIDEPLRNLSPNAFERTIAELFKHLGYSNCRVTGRSGDGGIDAEASRNLVGGVERIIIQCKRRPQVGVGAARELLGTVTTNKYVTKGYLVTTGEFSEPCRRLLQQHGNLAGISGIELAKLIRDNGVRLPGPGSQ